MSATDLIRQVAALPLQERALFIELMHALENGAQNYTVIDDQRWPDFTLRLHQIYGDKAASDSQTTIDEGRGDR